MAEIWLKIDGIDGESTSKAHAKWTPVNSIQWGVTNQGTFNEFPEVTKQDIIINKPLDKGTPYLFTDLVTGNRRPTATIEFTRNISTTEVVYYRLTLSDVLVTGLTQHSPDATLPPTESIALNFGKMDMIYYPTDPSTGKSLPGVSAVYDFRTSK